MFEQSVIEARALTARPWTLAVSLAGQGILITAAIVLPLLHPDTMQRVMFLVPVSGPPRGYHPPAPARMEVARRTPASHPLIEFLLREPVRVPTHVEMLQDPAPDVRGAASGPPGIGVVGGVDGPGGGSGVIDGLSRVQPPAAIPTVVHETVVKETPKLAAPQRITVGGNVQIAKLTSSPAPEYPPLAKAARISGSVHLSAVIGADGRIVNLRTIDGHPLLVRAAVDAVKRWTYHPTMLNGNPVEVVTEITVMFTLN